MCIKIVNFDFMLTFEYNTVNGIPEKSLHMYVNKTSVKENIIWKA